MTRVTASATATAHQIPLMPNTIGSINTAASCITSVLRKDMVADTSPFFETTGKLVDTWEIPTRTENSGELILPDIAASIKENNEKHGIEMGDIEGIGMGVPEPRTKPSLLWL